MKFLIIKLLRYFGYKISRIENFINLSSLDIIKTLFEKKDKIIIFDVGASIGQSTKNYRRIFPNSLIYAFEPFPEAYKFLSALNIKNYRAFNFGFSSKKSEEDFFINSEKLTTNSLLLFSKNASNVWGNESLSNMKKTHCNFDTIDNFVSEYKIQQIDFMKIDVQGAEYLVLEGAKNTLLQKIIKIIQIEVILGDTYVGQKSIGFYISLLESYGYKFKNFSDNIVINGKLIQSDLFFTV